jgi:hypothetical protein
MPTSVYQINKGVNKPVEFKGLKGQYIWYLAAAVIMLLIFFAVLYIVGVNTYLALAIIVCLGTFALTYIYQLSGKYGEYGLMKKFAYRQTPDSIRFWSRKIFLLKISKHGTQSR